MKKQGSRRRFIPKAILALALGPHYDFPLHSACHLALVIIAYHESCLPFPLLAMLFCESSPAADGQSVSPREE